MNKKELKRAKLNFPKNPNILGRNKLFNCAVTIPLVKIKKEYNILFQKRAKGISQGGDICFPGGGFDKAVDKNFKQTALREIKEELGVSKKDIKIVGQLDTMVAPMGIIETFVGLVKKRALKKMKIDKNEVEKTILIPVSYFKENKPLEYNLKNIIKPFGTNKNGKKKFYFPVEELNLPKRYYKPWEHKKHKIWVYKYKKNIIWGITSVILMDFLDKY